MKPRFSASSRVEGIVRLGDNVRIAQGTVLRSQDDSLRIGNGSMVLENSVLIGTADRPVAVGRKTVFGHKCVCIGATIGDLCEIGNGTIFLPGAQVGDFCLFGEGTLVPEEAVIPSGSVVVGRPGRILRTVTEQDRQMVARMRGGDLSLDPITEHITERRGKSMGVLHTYRGKTPQVADSAYIADTAELTGDVVVGERSVIAAGVRIIGDAHGPVRIGNDVHILENTVLHLLPANELILHDGVTVGPNCIVHGSTVGAGCVIEAGAIVCDFSALGENVLVTAGSLVPQRSEIAANAIVQGFPAKEIGQNPSAMERPDWAHRGK